MYSAKRSVFSPGEDVVDNSDGRVLEAFTSGYDPKFEDTEEFEVAIDERDGCDMFDDIDEFEVAVDEKDRCCMLGIVDGCKAVTEGIDVRRSSKYESEGVAEMASAYDDGNPELLKELRCRPTVDRGEIGDSTIRELPAGVFTSPSISLAARGRAFDNGMRLMIAVAWSMAVIRIASYL
jgi:hypothetical protein